VDITGLIHRAVEGDAVAADDLLRALYPDLRKLARARLSGHQRDVLVDTTALVHECYLRMSDARRLKLADRQHFLRYASCAMRSVIVDLARERQSARRGGGDEHVPLDTTLADQLGSAEEEILDVHAALTELAAVEPRLAQVVELRYFGGMAEADIAAALGITDRTVRRDWNKARLMLAAVLRA
jgi:RNA polymerase sigma factor (TIGR02999 family)